ncbi:hypothetical protein J2801_006085 [Paraburkholderia phenoliruptrix]|nr:hypothetical protein [Paraburkholderia phenoliruptrix]
MIAVLGAHEEVWLRGPRALPEADEMSTLASRLIELMAMHRGGLTEHLLQAIAAELLTTVDARW